MNMQELTQHSSTIATGVVAPDDLPALFQQFELEYPEGLAFPFQHKWSPPDGPLREKYTRKQTGQLVLFIGALNAYHDGEEAVPGHQWQVASEKFD